MKRRACPEGLGAWGPEQACDETGGWLQTGQKAPDSLRTTDWHHGATMWFLAR